MRTHDPRGAYTRTRFLIHYTFNSITYINLQDFFETLRSAMRKRDNVNRGQREKEKQEGKGEGPIQPITNTT